jgi:hypothetical protein
LLNFDNVYQITVTVQGAALELYLNLVMVGMEMVLRPPIPSDQIMPGNEIALNGNCIHVGYLIH